MSISLNDIEETVLSLPTPAALLSVEAGTGFRVRSVNLATRELLGPNVNDPVGHLLDEIPFRSDAGKIMQYHAEQTVADGDTHVAESSLLRADGTRLFLATTWAPIFDADDVVAIVLTLEDVSELVGLRMQRARELSLFASGFIRVCAWCGRVNDEGEWRSASSYVNQQASQPNETICPDCQSR